MPTGIGAWAWVAAVALAAAAAGQDAPLFSRPFDGVPISAEGFFGRTVPAELIEWGDDHLRALDPGGGPGGDPPALPDRFTDPGTIPSTTGMTAGGAYFGQFVGHDVTRARVVFNELLLEPFVFHLLDQNGSFVNRRTPGLDLDPVYRISPLEYPSQPGSLGPWDLSNLRFRFGTTAGGRPDFIRGQSGIAIIGDERNDENGVVAQIHRAFMKLHNVQVDRVIAREGIVEDDIVFLSAEWWDIFNEARNYVTAYYQGIVANEYAAQLTGRTLFDAVADATHPPGGLEGAAATVELAGAGFRLHTIIPHEVPLGAGAVGPFDEALRGFVPWPALYGSGAAFAGRLDTAVAAPLRNIINLVIPGALFPITLDLAQVNVLRGREMRLPSGEEYLAHLMDELGLDPGATTIRGKLVLTPAGAELLLDPAADADLLSDLDQGDTDLWAYLLLEAELNNGVLGPVGQDIFERNFAGLLAADDWSLMGAHAGQFTDEQMEFFSTATFARLLDEILSPADLDRDGHVGIIDFLTLLGHWGQSGTTYDVDGDGTVGPQDLDILLAEWGWGI